MAAKMIQAGYKVAYCAEAVVRHSHTIPREKSFNDILILVYFMLVLRGFSVTLAEPVVRVSAS